ncbi:MAG: IclR family transcriptional regulator [Patulibacter sp.]|nr:IclR family transcriptional regulator [Patulibacter sp.]
MVRALAVLEALADGGDSVTEIGRRAGLRPSTTHRMLQTLVTSGYAEHGSAAGRYALGHRAVLLAGRARTSEAGIRAIALPILQRVNRVARTTANLAFLDGGHAVFVEQAFAADSGARLLEHELRVPAHVSASGKAMLAFVAPERLRRFLPETSETFTDRTVTDRDALERELANVRRNGYAIDDQEFRSNFACVAAPVFDHVGAAVAAVSVAGWTTRVEAGEYLDLAELVGRSAWEISRELGYRGSSRWAPVAEA